MFLNRLPNQTMHNLEIFLQQADDLPSLPEIYIKLSEILEDEHSDAYEIGEAVQSDPSLTARILKLVNSAFYSLPNQITTISQAVSLLGRQQLKEMLLSTVLAGVFNDRNIDSSFMWAFWHHSVKTAIIARHLAMQNARILDHDTFFTAGLLHDIGRLIIAEIAPQALAEVSERVGPRDLRILGIEADILGVSHVDVGAALMKKWSMPERLTQCLIKHHDIEHMGPHAVDTSIVYLANQLSHLELPEDEEAMQEILSEVPNWEQSKNTMDQIYIACQLAEEQGVELMESLGLVDMEIDNEFD